MQIKGIQKSDLMQAGMPLSLDEVAAVSGETLAAASTLVNELVWQKQIYICICINICMYTYMYIYIYIYIYSERERERE